MIRHSSPSVIAVVVFGALICFSGLYALAAGDLYEQEPIRDSAAPVDDPVARLQERIDGGQVKLQFDNKHGYLSSVLAELKAPVSSQTLVFSRTSLQRNRISPKKPRALYFGDDAYVGWIKGGEVMEVAATDPKQGVIFYTLDQRPTERPKFVRQTDSCLQCHGGTMTRD